MFPVDSTRGEFSRENGNPGTSRHPLREAPGQTHFGDPADAVEALDLDALRAHVRSVLLRRIVGASAPWREHVACAGEPWSTFFIERGGSHDRARELCRSCVVREPCLAEAVDDESLDHGYRGGATAAERKALRKSQRGDAVGIANPPGGTHAPT